MPPRKIKVVDVIDNGPAGDEPIEAIETIEGAGHWVHAEKPQELVELIQGFLD